VYLSVHTDDVRKRRIRMRSKLAVLTSFVLLTALGHVAAYAQRIYCEDTCSNNYYSCTHGGCSGYACDQWCQDNYTSCLDYCANNPCAYGAGNFVATGPQSICASAKSTHVGYFEIYVDYQQTWADNSSCHQPSVNKIFQYHGYCTNGFTDYNCCINTVRSSSDNHICLPIPQYYCDPGVLQ
jgi:hypothetical protein